MLAVFTNDWEKAKYLLELNLIEQTKQATKARIKGKVYLERESR